MGFLLLYCFVAWKQGWTKAPYDEKIVGDDAHEIKNQRYNQFQRSTLRKAWKKKILRNWAIFTFRSWVNKENLTQLFFCRSHFWLLVQVHQNDERRLYSLINNRRCGIPIDLEQMFLERIYYLWLITIWKAVGRQPISNLRAGPRIRERSNRHGKSAQHPRSGVGNQ